MTLPDLFGEGAKGFLLAFAALLPILNPAATAPIFLSMTGGATPETQRLLARAVGRNVVWLLLGSMLVGSYVLKFFGISLPIVRVGGGLVIIAAAWRMLNTSHAGSEQRAALAESFTPEMARRQAFYPLTFPLSCGPGSISAAITVGVSMASANVAATAARFSGGIVALLALGVLQYLAYRYARQLLKPLGDVGVVVFLRLTAFILLCLGVAIFWDGAEQLLIDAIRTANSHLR